MGGFKDFFLGSPEKHKRQSTLLPGQEPAYNQLQASIQGKGAGGAFGSASDYWQNILSDNPELMQQFMAPEMRNFNEQVIPGLSEQFAGMGSGGLSSSGFRNAAVNAGAGLQERLGAIRANLKQQAAGGLMNLGQMGLQNYSQDVVTQPGSEGFLSTVGKGIGQGAGMAVGNWATGGMGGFGGMTGGFGKTNPYGSQLRRG